MPVTRALSARHALQNTQIQSNEVHSFSSPLFDHPIKSKTFSRTASMPTISIDTLSTWTETGNMNHTSNTSCQSTKSVSSTGRSLRSSSFTTQSLCSFSSRRGSGNGSDDEDEGERRGSSNRRRLGGCYPSSEQGNSRDDNNKENVAPLRRLSRRDLRYELAAQQAEATVRRTRTNIAVPMSDRSDSVPGSPRIISRRFGFRRTVSNPVPVTSTRKRSRSIFDSLEEGVERVERITIDSDIPSASTRPRLEVDSLTRNIEDDFGSVLNSSQATPMSEIFSLIGSEGGMSNSISRCTTPEPSESGAQQDKLHEQRSLEEEDLSVATVQDKQYSNVFSHARALLSYGSDAEVHIVGRDRERSAIQRFMQQRFGLFAHLERSAMPKGDGLGSDIDGVLNGGSLYVCGLPGTGKTALIRSLLADIQHSQELIDESERLQVAFIDCMTIENPRELFKRVLEALHGEIDSLPSGEAGDVEAEKRVAALMKDEKTQTLIVLDEIDHLLRTRVHQNILYRLFSWPQGEARACGLIGIANSLDLTERFVPLLASKGAAPAVLNFRPFEAEEIKNVIRSRLALLHPYYGKEQENEIQNEEQYAEKDDTFLPLFQPAAFELVARKIAAATGDLRKALDASRLAVELVEQETVQKSFTDSTIKLSDFTPSNTPLINPSHILKIVSTVLGSPQLNKIRGLALQPKLILLALLIAQKRNGLNLKVLSVGGTADVNRSMMGICSSKSNGGGTLMCEVESTYSAMLKNGDFPILESSELIDVMEGLEVEGIVKISNINGTSTNSSKSLSPIKKIGNVSPSAKRAAKRQLLASYRRMELTMSVDEILKGITTPPPMSQQQSSQSCFGSIPNTILIDSIKQIWQREERNAERQKGWKKVSEEAQRIRDQELGGGRGAVGI